VHVSAQDQDGFGTDNAGLLNARFGEEVLTDVIFGNAMVNGPVKAEGLFDTMCGPVKHGVPDARFKPFLCGHSYVLPSDTGNVLVGYLLGDREMAGVGLFAD